MNAKDIALNLNGLFFQLGLTVIFVGLAAAGIFWAIKSGQYDDFDGPAQRILMDDDDPMIPFNEAKVKTSGIEPNQNKAKAIYYGNPDELDAHAYETVVELDMGKFDINKLRKANKIGWRECEAIFLYRMHFRKSDPKVWKRFLKKVYKNGTERI